MKIVKGILITFAAVFVLFLGLVIASAFNPEISETLGEVLYSGKKEEQGTETAGNAGQGILGSESVSGSQTVSGSESVSDSQIASEETVTGTNETGNQPSSYYTASNDVTTTVTIDWNDRYAAKAQALAEEEAKAKAAKVSTKYIAPEEKNIKVPDAVSGRAAHTEIKDQGETLDDEAAKKLTGSINYGSLGQNYAFDSTFYPYFHMLNEREKNVYRQIYANANDLKTAFTPVEDVNASQLLNIFTAVCYDHPELYWIETAYGSKYNKNGICLQIELKYNDASKDEAAYWKKFSNDADAIIIAARGLSSDYEKEKYVHDILLEKAVYNKSAAMNQSAYSAIVNGQSVCAGYSRAFQYIMIKLGIPCYFVGGASGESHAWNIVRLGNEYYNVDLTWDDASQEGKYDYFNKTDEDFKGTHVRKGLSVNLPPCNGSTYRIAEDEEGNLQLNPHLRTLSDAGFNENDVFEDIWAYYDNCYWKVLENGKGYHTFRNVIGTDTVYSQWLYNNQNNLHWSNYLDSALKDLGATYAHITMDVEELQDDRYVITHTITVE